MNKKIVCMGIAIFIILSSSTLITVGVDNEYEPQASTLYVNTTFSAATPGWGVTHFDTIANATDNASAWDTILVDYGIYNEEAIIIEDKPLNITANSSLKPTWRSSGVPLQVGDTEGLRGNVHVDGFIINTTGASRTIYIRRASNCSFTNCKLYAHGASYVALIQGSYTNFTNCSIVGGTFVTIRDNTISGHVCGNNVYYKNSVSGPLASNYILELNTNNNNVIWNNFSNATGACIALQIGSGVSNNLVYHNNFLNNSIHAQDQGTDNIFNLSYPRCGNYWEGHNTTDNLWGANQDLIGSDGIVDGASLDPYKFTGNQDYYPFVGPYNGTNAQTGTTQSTLYNLYLDYYTSWAGEANETVWNNNSGVQSNYIYVDVEVNETQKITHFALWIGDLYDATNNTWVNASNITVYVSGDGGETINLLEYDVGNGNGVPLDGGSYMIINANSFGDNSNIFYLYGNGSHLNESCAFDIGLKIDIPDTPNGRYINTQNWKFYTNGSQIDEDNFGGLLDVQTEWFRKPGYTNCTYGVPDFDMHQNGWSALGPRGNEQWYMDGPVALLDCLWWIDCKQYDDGGSYFLPDLCGKGSKHPDNVEPLVDWLASNFLNTSMPLPTPDKSGTSAENFTNGTQNLLDYLNLSDVLSVTVEGYRDSWETPDYVNYTNITDALDNCSDVIALLGFWYYNTTSFSWNRIGGHYVQVNGYNRSNTSLSFSDPYIDWAEDGGDGWYSPHTIPHDNNSHNNTDNVSYDYWYLNTSTSPGGDWCIWDYPVQTGRESEVFWNWTHMNWWDDCPHGDSPTSRIRTELEVAWFIQQDYAIEVNKTVWNGTWWNKWYNASVGETLTFNITIWNTGKPILTNITIWDTFYDALGSYVSGSSYVVYPNRTRVAREPDSVSEEGGGCDYAAHSHLQYDFCDEFLTFPSGSTINIYFNLTVNNTNFSANNVTVYVCEESFCGFDCIGGTDLVNESTECYINQEFNTSINCTNFCFSDESNWTVSEHVHRDCTDASCLDETWFEYETEFDKWAPYNTSTFGNEDWGWIYRYDNSDYQGGDDLNLSYTIANNSCANRSQNVLRMRLNFTPSEETPSGRYYYYPFMGVIYSYTNDSWYDMVLYSNVLDFVTLIDSPVVSLVSKRYDTLMNTEDGSIVTGPYDIINYWDMNWSCNQSQQELDMNIEISEGGGIWSKINYKTFCGDLQVKAWGMSSKPFPETGHKFSLCEEPPGWIFDGNLTNITYQDEKCFGLVVWNPNGTDIKADFDFIDEWRLNYSYDGQANQSQIENHSSAFDKGIPLMNFNTLDYNRDVYNPTMDWFGNCFLEYFDTGNLTFQEYADCTSCKDRNLSNKFSMSSRMVYKAQGSCQEPYAWDSQNDSVYYYTAVYKNNTELPNYNHSLFIHVEDASDGTASNYDGVVFAIDVDNDNTWDDNDMCFLWYEDIGGDVKYNIWNGTTLLDNDTLQVSDSSFVIDYKNCSYWDLMGTTDLPVLHRYSHHRVYEAFIPLDYFEKRYAGSDWYLDSGDTFGINVMTVPYNAFTANPKNTAHPWSNWNETNCTQYYYLVPEDIELMVWETFMNVTTNGALDDFYFDGIWNGTNSFNIENWGHGRIGTQEGPLFDYDMHINKTANVSEITDITTDNLINYTIQVCNNGDYNVTNVVVHDILPSGAVYVSSSLPALNVTGSDRNWRFNLTDFLHHGDCEEFNITVNFTAGMAANGSTVYNYVNVTTLQGANASNQSGVKYGENSPPVIKWQYPVNGSSGVSLLLTNMSVGVGDADGTFNVSFFTNKTYTWNSEWNAIGSNLTQTNGSFHCNQTFNNSQWYNTRWRWGATTYYWTVNVTDGLVWVNKSYSYTTESSRYDVTTSGDVVSSDVSTCWTHRQGQATYDGLYDVDGSGDVVSADISLIWLNRT